SDNAVAGKLLLDGNVTTSASSVTSAIANGLSNTNAGTIDLDGGTRTFTVAQGTVPSGVDLSISAVIANGGLTKAGAGTLLLSNANTYSSGTTVSAGTLQLSGSGTLGSTSGGTTVNGGTLLVNNTSGSGTGTGNVTVNNTGTLGGTGTISGNVIVNSGGNLSPGNSPGILTTGSVTLNSGSNFVIEINGTTA